VVDNWYWLYLFNQTGVFTDRAPALGKNESDDFCYLTPYPTDVYNWGYTTDVGGKFPFDGLWHHIVLIYEPRADGNDYRTRISLYLDANLVKSKVYPSDTYTGPTLGVLGPEMDHIVIGGIGSRDNFENLWGGYYDEFAIYPGVLSACRVRAHYKAWQNRFNCQEYIDCGYGLPADLNRDCKINFDDFAIFASNWLKCNDPRDPNCSPNWLQFSSPGIAAEVISIDLNASGNNVAYSGKGAVDSNAVQVWQAYYPGLGWGKAMGSPRSSNLADYNEPCMPSTYAAQVWIGINPNDTNYVTYGPSPVTWLMNDGFKKAVGATADPCIHLWGQGAYGGMGDSESDPNFDIYVYGGGDGNACTFHLWSWDPYGNLRRYQTLSVTGDSNIGEFIYGQNYVIFHDVNVGGTTGYDACSVFLSFSGAINGLQLVKLTSEVRPTYPKECKLVTLDSNEPVMTGFEINAPAWDVSYWTNRRDGAPTYFGPSLGVISTAAGGDPWEGNVHCVTYIDGFDSMSYDINVPAASQGNYIIWAWLDTTNGTCGNLKVYIDNVLLGTFESTTSTGGADDFVATNTNAAGGEIFGNFFKGAHTFMWQSGAAEGYNLWKFTFERMGDVNMPDCNAVYKYGFGYPGDFNHNCHVDFNDLKVLTDAWLTCYSPDPNDCLP
jgi:hypothetical protein